ncbi:MAG: rRNA maturation RNase YbeY [Bacteroidales bacterium]|nr:rRNA maturation RNase YbeY [Bacteroidales bacterium]
MSITFDVQEIDFKLKNKTKLTKWISSIIKDQSMRVGDIAYLFTNDEKVYETNMQFLNHDTYTDIITFDYVTEDLVSGDIIISVDRVKENAELYNDDFQRELHRVIIHGILHLLGQGDKTKREAAQMRKKEQDALVRWEEEFAPNGSR